MDAPPVGRTIKNYLGMGVGAAIGFGVSNRFFRLGTRVANAFSKWKIVEDNHASLVGSAVAIIVYLSVLGYGWYKKGLGGDIAVGFAAGALFDEVTAIA